MLVIPLKSARHEQSKILKQLEEFDDATRRLDANMTARIADLRKEVVNAMQGLRIEFAKGQLLTHRKHSRVTFEDDRQCNLERIDCEDKYKNMSTLLESHNEAYQTDGSALSEKFFQLHIHGKAIATSLALLSSFAFTQMDFRRSQISKAQFDTFRWVFSEKFLPWIRSPEPIYWISGKPGSGKSTLMKFLVDNERTPILLREWSGPQNQVVASYFFWVNGTAVQRSLQGLFQSLLYEFLRQCPDLIEPTFPDMWKKMSMTNHTDPDCSWKYSDLLNGYKRLTELNVESTKFCIFIDGLDEYEGDHEELVEAIRLLAEMPNVKLCIASRPWNIFEDAFGSKRECKLYLQDLNRRDIQTYVKTNLGDHKEFHRIQRQEIEANNMLDEIVDKSQGVFLWVYLVVKSLREGLRNHDRLSQLRMRLKDFPTDLEDFFKHIFQSLDPIYRTLTAHALRVALSAPEPLPIMCYWYLDEEDDIPDIALMMPVKATERRVVECREAEMQIRLNGRYKGLLEVTSLYHGSSTIECVDFLHRTVKDFLTAPEMQKTLDKWQNETFDADLAICKSSLAVLKSIPPSRFADITQSLFSIFMSSAKAYEMQTQTSQLAYMNEFERTMSTINTINFPSKTCIRPGPWETRSMLEEAIGWDLQIFTEKRLSDMAPSITMEQRMEILSIVLRTPETHPQYLMNPKFVEVVFSANPLLDINAVDFPKGQLDSEMPWEHMKADELFCFMRIVCQYGAVTPELKKLLKRYRNRFSQEEFDDLHRIIRQRRTSQLIRWRRSFCL